MKYVLYIADDNGTWFSVDEASIIILDEEGQDLLDEGHDLFDEELDKYRDHVSFSSHLEDWKRLEDFGKGRKWSRSTKCRYDEN
jgi:hypothetical protein